MKPKTPHNMTQRSWTTKKGKQHAYYHRGPRPDRRLTPLGTDYQQALLQWAKLEGIRTLPPKSGTVGKVYEEFKAWMNTPALSDLAPRTISDRVGYWKNNLQDVVEHANIDDLQPEEFLEYFELRSSQSGAKKELKFLQAMFNWARARGKMRAPNPLGDGFMRQLKVDDARKIYVTDYSYALALKHGTQLVRDVMEFTYICGNRPQDTSSTKFSDISDGYIAIELQKTKKKGVSKKLLPITGDLKAFIKRQQARPIRSMYIVSDQAGQRVRIGGTFRTDFKHARDAAEKEAKETGIEFQRFQLRDIRAKAATDMDRDHGIEAARKLLGHTTQKQTADYIRHLKGQAAQALEITSEIIRQAPQLQQAAVSITPAERSAVKLNEFDVQEIIKRINLGESNISIGKSFSVSDRTISAIKNGQTWKHISRG